MGRTILVGLIIGTAGFVGIGWGLGWFTGDIPFVTPTDHKLPHVDVTKLGPDLYAPAPFPAIVLPKARTGPHDKIYGVLNAIEQETVPSAVPGQVVLFIGEQVDDSAVLVAGSAPFLAEPYYFADVYAGGDTKFVKFYRRLYEGDTVRQGQMLGLVNPSEALGSLLKELAKVAAADADLDAAKAAEEEGFTRKKRADHLYFVAKAINAEDYGAAVLTYIKLKSEAVSAREKVKIALKDQHLAEIKLHQHEIRSKMPYLTSTIKSIQSPAGSFLKTLEPSVLTLINLERLMAEALIEEQYFTPLKDRPFITATIEPTVLEKPMHEFPGHALDVNSVAVSKKLKIVSGSDDRTVCVWTPQALAPERRFEHDDAVKVIACSPVAAKHNLCLAGCADGNIYIWDLDKAGTEPLKIISKAHGGDASITSLAFSPDGTLFASGASDGTIRMWNAEDGLEKYSFTPENQCHEDAVTALNFTPQCKLISAGRDKSLRVWQLKEKGAAPEGKPILYREGNVPNLGVSQDGKWMLFDQGRTLKLLSVETHALVHTLNMPTNSTPFDTLALFSPDGSLMLTAGAPEGRLQLWHTPDADSRAFEVRQFAARERQPVACAAFSPDAGKGGPNSFAVSASGQKIYMWPIPTKAEVAAHPIPKVRMTLKSQTLDTVTRMIRVGFEVDNSNLRLEPGRPVTIVID